MRKYDVDGVGIQTLKTKPNEITAKEFKQIIKSQNDSLGDYTHYLDTFKILGFTDEYLDVMTSRELIMTIIDFQEDFVVDKMINEFELDGYTYRAYDKNGQFELGARDLAMIENEMKKDNYSWITFALAVVFKRTDLSLAEHRDNAHIKHKSTLLNDITMDIALPYIVSISGEYLDNIKLLATIK